MVVVVVQDTESSWLCVYVYGGGYAGRVCVWKKRGQKCCFAKASAKDDGRARLAVGRVGK
jgi:hypothetical protein